MGVEAVAVQQQPRGAHADAAMAPWKVWSFAGDNATRYRKRPYSEQLL